MNTPNPAPPLVDRLSNTYRFIRAEIESLEARSLKAIKAGDHDAADGMERCAQVLTIDADRLQEELRLLVKVVAQTQPLMDWPLLRDRLPSGVRHRVGCTRLGATLTNYPRWGPTCECCGVTG